MVTHINRSTGTTSAPDITIVHPSILDSIERQIVNGLNSDHLPIIISIEGDSDNLIQNERFNWNLKKVDLSGFKYNIDNNLIT